MSAEAIDASKDQIAVLTAIQRASAATGSDFQYLLGTAMRESSLKPSAQSSTSSASGLFQFVEQTWYGLVKDYGAKYGLGSYADAIARGGDGCYRADNASDRQAILALRGDPQVSALMAGEYAHQTKCEMEGALGRSVCGGELYAAHFLGADAACKLIAMNGAEPAAAAADAFPQAAASNKSVFYRADGTPKTVREVYDWATRQVAVPAAGATAPTAAASAMSAPDQNVESTLVALWQPNAGGFFHGGESAGPLALTPGVLDLLSSFSSVAKDGGDT
jgi:hypothetical protein